MALNRIALNKVSLKRMTVPGTGGGSTPAPAFGSTPAPAFGSTPAPTFGTPGQTCATTGKPLGPAQSFPAL